MVSRLGGDEFVLSKQTCSVGLTVGYAIAPLDGIDTSNILRQADEAMYLGKRTGKSRIVRSANERGLNDDDLLALLG